MSSVSTTPAPARLPAALADYPAQLQRELERGRLLRLAAITAQFALVVLAIRITNIEARTFERVVTLAFAGFLVNHFLPATWRMGFFAALSLASVPLVFGLPDGAWLLAMGGVLIGLCHLPLPMRARIALLLAVAALMALDRGAFLPWGPAAPSTIWPILGAMFMFRLIVYLYDLANKAAPFSPGRAAAYFFMLPNVCFPLFPVVDYKTLQRAAYNDDALRLYQTGLKWMLRGLIHLALYKVVYFLAAIEPGEAVTGTDAARYMIATYLLYLKISGLFHLIVGLLHMYGFGLSETHHLYLFAASFTDFWRRINIYWKDFIQKLVFNPIYFAAKARGGTYALVVATLVAFAATWAFHSYQWFWIRAEFPVVWSDLVFWFGLGVVVLANVLIETRFGRRRSLTAQARPWREKAVLALQIAATFAAICTLWTIWSTPDLAELGALGRALLNSGPGDIAVLLGVPLGMGLLGALFGGRLRETSGTRKTAATEPAFWRQAATVGAGAALFILVALQPSLLDPVSPQLAQVVRDVRDRNLLNAAEAQRMVRGYYEDLGDAGRFNGELWLVYNGQPPGWGASDQDRARDDATRIEYVPATATGFKGALRTINSHGLRDREYSLVPGPDTFRIALIGSSNEMGAGVGDAETFENLVEDRLNRDLGPLTGRTYEILNFSRGGATPTEKLAILTSRALAFQPDLVIYSATRKDLEWTFAVPQLQHLVRRQLLDQFPMIARAMADARVPEDADALGRDAENVARQLEPFAEKTFTAVLDGVRAAAAAQGIDSALLLVELPDDTARDSATIDRISAAGTAAGLPVMDLRGAFAAVSERTDLWIVPWDAHVNAAGHRMLADRLYDLLLAAVPTEAGN